MAIAPELWFPYAQMKTMPSVHEVVSAEGVYLQLADGRRLIDAIASWWCVIHGYNHPELTAAAKDQLDTLPHVMMGGLANGPASDLARRLVAWTPSDLNHVFFSDSGSVGVEVALKMSIQFWRNQGNTQKTRFLALTKAYHGDTIGCMSVCDPANGMHALFADVVLQNIFIEAPRGGFTADEAILADDLAALEAALKRHHQDLAGFILEPLMQAAGGFHFYSPVYLQKARELCDRYGVLLIFDEVATGFGRTGARFAAELAGVVPDIMVLGKGMTAGYAGHAATLARDHVYEAFYDDDPAKCLMHGPTFMGNATVCAIANKSLEIFERDNYLSKIQTINRILQDSFLPIASPHIRETRVLGACGVIETHSPGDLVGLQDFAMERGVWVRPFGCHVYTVPPYVITEDELRTVAGVLRDWFARA